MTLVIGSRLFFDSRISGIQDIKSLRTSVTIKLQGFRSRDITSFAINCLSGRANVIENSILDYIEETSKGNPQIIEYIGTILA